VQRVQFGHSGHFILSVTFSSAIGSNSDQDSSRSHWRHLQMNVCILLWSRPRPFPSFVLYFTGNKRSAIDGSSSRNWCNVLKTAAESSSLRRSGAQWWECPLYVCVYIYIYIYAYVCVCVCVYVRMYVCVRLRAYICIYVGLYVYACVCVYVLVCRDFKQCCP
jgi:hypothetical protein